MLHFDLLRIHCHPPKISGCSLFVSTQETQTHSVRSRWCPFAKSTCLRHSRCIPIGQRTAGTDPHSRYTMCSLSEKTALLRTCHTRLLHPGRDQPNQRRILCTLSPHLQQRTLESKPDIPLPHWNPSLQGQGCSCDKTPGRWLCTCQRCMCCTLWQGSSPGQRCLPHKGHNLRQRAPQYETRHHTQCSLLSDLSRHLFRLPSNQRMPLPSPGRTDQ